jgi:hypothetical protein
MVRYEATKAGKMFFLASASGSSKSASLPGLRATLPRLDWRNFDEFGVPSRCPPEWRPLATEQSLPGEGIGTKLVKGPIEEAAGASRAVTLL